MNNKEQETADKLLVKLQNAEPGDAVQIANAYQALTQGALNRANAKRAAN